MDTYWKLLLHWSPRVLCVAFALFLSVFALDVFGEGLGFGRTILALLIHLIPTWLVLAALAVSWKWPWAGAGLYVGLGLLYLIWSWGRFHWSAYALISGPLFLIGGLFLADWLLTRSLRFEG